MLTIGEKIRYFRDLKGYSQEYMAQKLGISTKTYNSLETEKTKVSLDKVQKIAKLLEIDWLELLSYGEKITQINTGDVEGNNNQVNAYSSPTSVSSLTSQPARQDAQRNDFFRFTHTKFAKN